MRILTPQQEELLQKERQCLTDLRVALAKFGATDEDNKALAESISQLDDLFLLVVVGEFNAGKSAFINALLGQSLLKEGVTPTTTQITLLRYGPASESIAIGEHQQLQKLPIEWLADISIVDTPGTNAIIRSHEVITAQFIPRSDLVIFITSADRPFTESERTFMEQIRNWGKKVVIVINKIDILQSQDELDQVCNFVAANARNLLGITPELFPVSARLALRAKQGESSCWEPSNFEALENFIRQTLDETSRLNLKLLNPLGVGSHLVDRYLGFIRNRLDLLRDDLSVLSDVEAQLTVYRSDMYRDFDFRMADMENALMEMEQRGQDFFDETFRLARVIDLFNKERIQHEFEQKVVGNVPLLIESKANELVDWLVDTDLRQWKAVNDHLADRRRAYQDRIVGDAGPGNFQFDRERLVEGVARQAQRVVDTYDKTAEAQAIASGARDAVAASAVLEIGAVSLGTIIAVVASTAAADITGVLLASLLAALGIFIIPAKRKAAKAEMRTKVMALREQLTNALRTQFEKEIERSLSRINEAIAPYTRFVRAERDKLSTAQSEFEWFKGEINRIKQAIDNG